MRRGSCCTLLMPAAACEAFARPAAVVQPALTGVSPLVPSRLLRALCAGVCGGVVVAGASSQSQPSKKKDNKGSKKSGKKAPSKPAKPTKQELFARRQEEARAPSGTQLLPLSALRFRPVLRAPTCVLGSMRGQLARLRSACRRCTHIACAACGV